VITCFSVLTVWLSAAVQVIGWNDSVNSSMSYCTLMWMLNHAHSLTDSEMCDLLVTCWHSDGQSVCRPGHLDSLLVAWGQVEAGIQRCVIWQPWTRVACSWLGNLSAMACDIRWCCCPIIRCFCCHFEIVYWSTLINLPQFIIWQFPGDCVKRISTVQCVLYNLLYTAEYCYMIMSALFRPTELSIKIPSYLALKQVFHSLFYR